MLTLKELLEDYSSLPEYSEIECSDVNTISLFGDYPIHVAATRGSVEELKLIINEGADINLKGEHGYTALHDAVAQEKIEAILYLLQHGAVPAIKNDDGLTPLDIATLLENKEIISELNKWLQA